MINPMTMYENIGYWMGYCFRVFKYFNGTINYKLPANDVTFGEPHKFKDNFVFGHTKLDLVCINLLDIIHYCVKMNVTNEEDIKCLIIFTILHELSHCDQDINYRAIKYDKKEIRRMEVSNDRNTMAFLLQYYDQISSDLGSFRLNILDRILCPIGNLKEHEILYTRITHQSDKVIRVLEYLTETPLRQAFEENQYQNCGVEFIDQTNNHQNQIVMRNGLWMPFYKSFKVLRRAMVRGEVLDISIHEVASNKGLFISVNQKSNLKDKPLYLDKRRIQS